MKSLPQAEPHLDEEQAEQVFGSLLDGEVSEDEIARFLCDLSNRGETADEIAGAARALRARGVSFVISTGYGAVEAEFADAPVLHKPYAPARLTACLLDLLGG